MGDVRFSRAWDREVEESLPDCRLRYSERETVFLHGTRLPVQTVYCANCGSVEGYATVQTPHIFCLCDKCVGKNGKPPGLTEMTKKQMAERGLRVVPM